MRHKLTTSRVKALIEPGIYGDGDGLYLRVQANGGRSWIFIWHRFNVRREIGFGAADRVGLAAARAKAEEARSLIAAGRDPRLDMAERRASMRPTTFGEIADQYVEAMAPKWRGETTLTRWKRAVTVYCKPIRAVPVGEVSVDHVLRTLRPLWHTKSATASKLRETIKLVLDSAKARGLRSGDNPAEWDLLRTLLPPPQTGTHHEALPYARLPEVMRGLAKAEGNGARALEFVVLTACRSGEATGAVWAEFDLAAKLWVIPASRMKEGKEHRVPLSPQTLAVLDRMKAQSIGEYVFRPLSGGGGALLNALAVAGGGDAVVHGLRSSFRDWCSEQTSYPRELCEAALAHATGSAAERAYARSDLLERRREMMAAWGRFCASESVGDNVVALPKR